MASVLVTGAGRGIGSSITRHLSDRGWEVFATARSAADLEALGGLPRVHPIELDVTDRAAVAALQTQLPDSLDGVVNNAGIIVQGPVEGLPLDALSRQLEVNVVAQVAVTQSVLPLLRKVGGRVVFMSSVSGLITTPSTGAYSASKYALESVADALRMELRPWGIRVALIEPGPTRTDMWADALTDYDRVAEQLKPEIRDLYASHLAGTRTLLGRMQRVAGDPAKVVAAVEHALTSRHPRRRYRTDHVSRLQLALATVSPTAVNDAVLASATTARS